MRKPSVAGRTEGALPQPGGEEPEKRHPTLPGGRMDPTFLSHLDRELAGVREAGLEKRERVIASPQ